MGLRKWNFKKTCISMLLVVACSLSSFLFLFINAKADNIIRTGIVEVSSSLNFRSGPGTSYGVVGYLYNGDQGTIIGQDTASNGKIWYNMIVNGKTGWASSSYVRVVETVVKDDVDFDAYLTAQGFPDTYKAQLQALHAMYPNWVFEAQHTNLEWKDAVAGESTLAKNLVHSGAVSSWKSTQDGAYDWETGEWTEYDSGGWVAASTEIVQHFMDPRNFLDSTNIFQFIKQSYNVNTMTPEAIQQKKTDLIGMVKNTYLAGNCPNTTTPYVDVIMSAEAESGVCPFTLASMMIQEQGTDGSGRSISGTVSGYEGYYNYLNIAAYKDSRFSSAVVRGLWYASGGDSGSTTYRRPWNNAVDSITGGAIYYGAGYVKVGQDTLYLKKFNVQGSNIYGHQYMTNVQGAASEGKHMAKAYDENARKSALVFKIPVYKNMPATPCVKPTGDGNPNYMLKSLAVLGYSLTPTFNMYETSYSLIVPNDVTSVSVAAQTYVGTTSIAGTGAHNLEVGQNTIRVVTTAQSGGQRTYTIQVVRQEAVKPNPDPEPENPPVVTPTPELGLSGYQMNSDRIISGISDYKTLTVSEFKKKFAVNNGSLRITTSNGSDKKDGDKVGTGDQVRVFDNEGVYQSQLTCTVVIYGDTNGDGQVTVLDLLRVQKHILGISQLTGCQKSAADTSKDNSVTALDLLQVQKDILNIKPVTQ